MGNTTNTPLLINGDGDWPPSPPTSKSVDMNVPTYTRNPLCFPFPTSTTCDF